ncbi:hypothetical protein [Bacillus thuringiensis]|nr:hypothetical protein [Bacillus thuringiensis]
MKRILKASFICFSLFSFISINSDDFYQKKVVDQETIIKMKADPGGGG